MRLFLIYSLLVLLFISCEKESYTSQGHGGSLSRWLKFYFYDWDVDEVKRFSGTSGIVIEVVIRGGDLESGTITMVDTTNNKILFQKFKSPSITDHFYFKDTIYLPNISDTINAKIMLEGKDADEMGNSTRMLKIGK